jgi:hypothetical protein
LNTIGFIWKVRNIRQIGEGGINTGWNARFQQLEEYKNANGDCKVPISYSENIELGRWVNMQRYKKKNDFLSEEQQRKLNAIGFRWSVNCRVGWNELFRQLLKYKVAFGDCDVPKNFSPNPKLGLWVYRQQQNKSMSKRRCEQLNSIGFYWGRQEEGILRNMESFDENETCWDALLARRQR